MDRSDDDANSGLIDLLHLDSGPSVQGTDQLSSNIQDSDEK